MLRARDGLKSGNLPASVSFDAYLLSDFQRRIADMASAPADSSVKVHLLALKANATSNVFIDTCYLESPVVQLGSPNELIVSLRNSGEKPVENIPVRLTINGYQRHSPAFRWKPAPNKKSAWPSRFKILAGRKRS